VIFKMWRCRTCGKWSHARRKPRKHQRWVRDEERPIFDAFGETGQFDGDFVDCGPFDPYVAYALEVRA